MYMYILIHFYWDSSRSFNGHFQWQIVNVTRGYCPFKCGDSKQTLETCQEPTVEEQGF